MPCDDRRPDVPDRGADLALEVVLLDELGDGVAVAAVDRDHELHVLVTGVPRGDLVVLRCTLGRRRPDLDEVDAGLGEDRLRAVDPRLDVPGARRRDDPGHEVALLDLLEDLLRDRGARGEVVLADVGHPVVLDPRRDVGVVGDHRDALAQRVVDRGVERRCCRSGSTRCRSPWRRWRC